MKKSILFVIDSLHCAGAEKSLTTLLNLLDYSKYSVDLQLFGYGGEFEKLLPKEVNLLEPLEYSKFTQLSLKDAIKDYKNNRDKINARLRYSIRIRIGKTNNVKKSRIFWSCTKNTFKYINKEYDFAIAYAQGIPTYYVADKIMAKKKFAWVNVSHTYKFIDRKYNKKYYNKFDKINAVSESTKDIFLKSFPKCNERIVVIKDITDHEFINSMADIGESYDDNFSGIRILTIGRLAEQKGYNIALEACKLLKEKGVNFRWYVLGKGPLENAIKKEIDRNKLHENFILLGVKANPYRYIRECDIYVQTSKFEGYGIAIAEARMLNKPIVTTKFDAVFTQMVDKKNGLVVDINEQAVCDGILEVMNNEKLRLEIIEYLKNEKKGNIEELDKFYELIG